MMKYVVYANHLEAPDWSGKEIEKNLNSDRNGGIFGDSLSQMT
jgi:hypothetical protein